MKQITTYIFALALLLLLPGCKKDNWIDWKTQNTVWLANNRTKKGVIVTPTGLQYEVIRQGVAGTKPDDLKTVKINIIGRLITGHVFQEQCTITSEVASLIYGMQEGLKKMNKSGIYTFYIPYNLAYGSSAQANQGIEINVPPYSTLIFDVELLDVY